MVVSISNTPTIAHREHRDGRNIMVFENLVSTGQEQQKTLKVMNDMSSQVNCELYYLILYKKQPMETRLRIQPWYSHNFLG